ncbi:gene transfer agent family protein [Parasphingorhabdus sp.]|uniref:gene transfer agent family protein n=1 Tax=Parasphingorhabdus sp. TaxID=2709688 RepID=UPI003266CE58
MSDPANIVRGETSLKIGGYEIVLRPSFGGLVAVEEELGSLLALVGRAADGQLKLSEITTLFWYLVKDRPEHLTRKQFDEAIVSLGLSGTTPALKTVLKQILQGHAAGVSQPPDA